MNTEMRNETETLADQRLFTYDLVILAGVPCDFRLDYGRSIRSSSVLISANRSRVDLTRNRRPQIAILGDPAACAARYGVAEGTPPMLTQGDLMAALAARNAEAAQACVKLHFKNGLAAAV